MSKQKIFIRNTSNTPAAPEASEATTSTVAPEPFDVERLLSSGAEILRREIVNLMRESSSGKLEPNSARDLVNYIKLLSELKEKQAKELENLSDEELAALVNK